MHADLTRNQRTCARSGLRARSALNRSLQRAATVARRAQPGADTRSAAVQLSRPTCKGRLASEGYEFSDVGPPDRDFHVRVSRVRRTRLAVWTGTKPVDSLQDALIAPTSGQGETYLLVPHPNTESPYQALAMTLINNLWPAPNPDGLDSLPPARPMRTRRQCSSSAHLVLRGPLRHFRAARLTQTGPRRRCKPSQDRTSPQTWETAHESLSSLPRRPGYAPKSSTII